MSLDNICAVAHFNTFIAPDGLSYITEFSYLDCQERVLNVRIKLPPHTRDYKQFNNVYSCPTILNRVDGCDEMRLTYLKWILTRNIWPEIIKENPYARIGLCLGRRDHRQFFRKLSIP